MTLAEYIKNPMGGRVPSNRTMMYDMYRDKWNLLMTRENGKIDYKLYIDGDTYVAHLKIPSEAIEKFYYDIVLQFKPKKVISRIDEMECYFFSNDPIFTYTFAYVFHKKKMTINELLDKYAKMSLEKKPLETNPNMTTGYIKTFFFAYLFMLDKGFIHTLQFKNEATPINWKVLSKLITKTEDKLQERSDEEAKLKKKIKKDKQFNSRPEVKSPEVLNTIYTKTIGKIPSIGSSFIGHTKRSSNKISSVKKTKRR